MRHADDGVHGGADFVAHVGQEIALGAAGGVCRLLGFAQLLLDLLLLGDISKGADEPARRAIGQPKAPRPVRYLVHQTVAEDALGLLVHRDALADDQCILLGLRLALGQRHAGVVEHRLADHGVALLAHEFLEGAVGAQVSALGVLVKHGHRHGVEQCLLERQLLGHARLQQLLHMHVDVHPDRTPGLAVGVAHNARRQHHPAPLAIRAHDAPGILNLAGRPVHAALEMLQRLCTVVRVQGGRPVGQRAAVGARWQAQHFEQLVGPHDLLTHEVCVEHPDQTGLLHQRQAFVRLAHCGFGTQRLGDVLDDPQRALLAAGQLHTAPGQARLEGGAIEALHFPYVTHRLLLRQRQCHTGVEVEPALHTAKQALHGQPDQGLLRRAHELRKSRVAAAKTPIAHQQDGWRVVEDGGLLVQQLVELALTLLQLLLRVDARCHVLLQPHHGDAAPLLVEHRRERGVVMVDAAVAPLVDELTAPGAAREQLGPHFPVRVRRRLAAGDQPRLAAAHFGQAVSGAALVLRVDPLDAALCIGDDHTHRAALQRRAQHLKALHHHRHPCAAAQNVQQHAPQQQQHDESAAPHLPAQRGRHEAGDIVQRHELPGARGVKPLDGLARDGVGLAIDLRACRPCAEWQGGGHAVVEMRTELAQCTHLVNTLLRQRRQHGVLPIRPRGSERHTLGRQQQHGHAAAQQQCIERLEARLQHDGPNHGARGRIPGVQWGGVVQPARKGLGRQGGVNVGHAAQRLLQIRLHVQVEPGHALTRGVVGDDRTHLVQHIDIAAA